MALKAVTTAGGLILGAAQADITPTTWLVFDGDSITWGDGEGVGSAVNAFPALVGNMVRAAQPSEIVADINLGIPGNSWTYDWPAEVHIGSMASRAPTYVDPILAHAGTKWLIAFAGTNGYGQAGNSAATEYTNFLTYLGDRLTAGWPADKIVVCTMLPRGSGSAETFRSAYNASLVSGAATYGYKLARFDLNTAFDGATDNANTTYFVDGLHPTLAGGHPIMASIIYATMFP